MKWTQYSDGGQTPVYEALFSWGHYQIERVLRDPVPDARRRPEISLPHDWVGPWKLRVHYNAQGSSFVLGWLSSVDECKEMAVSHELGKKK